MRGIHDQKFLPVVALAIKHTCSAAPQPARRSIARAPAADEPPGRATASAPPRRTSQPAPRNPAPPISYAIPRPPPQSTYSIACPSARNCRTSSATRSIASRKGSSSVICDPICTLTPAHLQVLASARARVKSARFANGHAEFVLLQSGRNIGMRVRAAHPDSRATPLEPFSSRARHIARAPTSPIRFPH